MKPARFWLLPVLLNCIVGSTWATEVSDSLIYLSLTSTGEYGKYIQWLDEDGQSTGIKSMVNGQRSMTNGMTSVVASSTASRLGKASISSTARRS